MNAASAAYWGFMTYVSKFYRVVPPQTVLSNGYMVFAHMIFLVKFCDSIHCILIKTKESETGLSWCENAMRVLTMLVLNEIEEF